MKSIIAQLVFAAWVLATIGQVNATNDPRMDYPDQRPTIDLSGEWEFRMDPEDIGLTNQWYSTTVPFDRTLKVPGAWNAQGIGFESEQQLRAYEKLNLNGRNLPGVDRESEKLYHVYPGPAWYWRSVTIPAEWQGKIVWLKFGGVHRMANVWVNGISIGTHIGYVTPFKFDVSSWIKPGEKAIITVRVDARRNKAIDPLMGCMDTLDFLYVSWGGIHRPVTLEATTPAWIENIFAIPHLADSTFETRVALGGRIETKLPVNISIYDSQAALVAQGTGTHMPGETNFTLALSIPNPQLWSPTHPSLYTIRATVPGLDSLATRTGMREFKVEQGRFLLNGRPIFLRGYGDDCIFPNTIAPSPERDAYRRRLTTIKDYGFNYARHHSWIPLEEYFEVADELGLMVQPEFPIAYRWDLGTTPAAQRLYLEQWEGVIRNLRNHPSLVTWCMGNELYDSFELAPQMYQIAKQNDPTRLIIDSDGCGFQHKNRKTLDFMVVQFNESGSCGFLDRKYDMPAGLGKPVVAHEMGYFVTLPDLSQLQLFQSGLRPYWLLQAKELAAKKGLTDVYPRWVDYSSRLQAACLKANYEAVRRSRLSGYSQWLFQDYPNCAEGVVDMFFGPKAISAAEFRKFNAPTVLLLDAPRRNFRSGEHMALKILASRYEEEATDNSVLTWILRSGDGVLAKTVKSGPHVSAEGLQELMPFELPVPRHSAAETLKLTVELADHSGKAVNDWNLWVFPDEPLKDPARRLCLAGVPYLNPLYPWANTVQSNTPIQDCELLVTTRFDEAEKDYLKGGGRIILLAPGQLFPTVPSRFRPCGWDPGQTEGHSGTVIDKAHPLLRAMPSEGWCDLQFFFLLQDSKIVLLDTIPAPIQPIVRCIDMPQRFLSKAYLFEVAAGKGKLLVSGFNFAGAIKAQDPAAMFLIDQFVRYGLGPQFAPATALPVESLQSKRAQ